MSKELIEKPARVDRRLTEAHELIEQQQKRIEEQALQVLSAQAQAQESYEQLVAAQAQLSGIAEQLKQQCSDPALDFCHRFAVLMECMILSDKPHNCWDEANSLLEQYHLALEEWREANGEPYVSGFGKD